MNHNEIQNKITDLRHKLHTCPEVSGQEEKTKKMLMEFLEENTSLQLKSCGQGFYAAHREVEKRKSGIAFRADYDALALPEGGAAHLCGHDGHAAALCGLALFLEGKIVGRDVFLIFQPAEEIGAGAKRCTEIFEKEAIGEIYGLHNLPGVPLGQVTTRSGTFACASQGMTITFRGKATHAAYPENGISPADAVGKLLCALSELSAPEKYDGMTLCTVIGVSMGEKAFGAAAAQAEIWLTIRGEHDIEMHKLFEAICSYAEILACEEQLKLVISSQDVFPSTENDTVCAAKVLEVCQGDLLEEPMRWSEDFGYYLKHCHGAFFGIGAGATHAPLHTEKYEYPDELLPYSIEAFWKLLMA